MTVLAEVATVASRRMRGGGARIFEAVVTDGHGRLMLTFFGRGSQRWTETGSCPACAACSPARCPATAASASSPTRSTSCSGAGTTGARAAEYAAEMIPVYPATARARLVEDRRRGADGALDVLDMPEDPLPRAIRERHGLCGLADALRGIHRPAGPRGRAGAPAAAQVGRGVRAAGGAGPAAAGGGRLLGDAAARAWPAGCWTSSTRRCRSS